MSSPSRLTIFVATVVFAGGCSRQAEPVATAPKAPLYDNLGSLQHTITTASPEAQSYFNQGLRLSYAFNHAEAIRSFRQAIALDPGCAMCYWGVAYALGPNINAPITPEAAKEAFAAIEEARKRAPGASAKEQAFIEALAKRYSSNPGAERPPLDAAYADAMRAVANQYPEDPEAGVLFAQSLMDTSPWSYWNADGSAKPQTSEVIGTLESVLKQHPDHIGAIHFYIHAVEASPDPKRAEAYADRLAALSPGAGHLVHMPAHIYLRTGRFADASRANVDAQRADAAYLAGDRATGNMLYEMGYVTHNLHFFAFSASMEQRREDALKAAEELKGKLHADMLRDPAMGGMVQHFMLTPLFTKVRFSMWDDVLAEPAPADDLPYMRAIWHTARTMAQAAKGQVKEAEGELAALAKVKDDPSLKNLWVSSVNTASAIAAIGHEVASGELRAAQKRTGDAMKHYAAAVALEDRLTYMEPPDWPIPVRQLQGAALRTLGRAKEAELAFQGDLVKFPNNSWSVEGLSAGRK
jgi:tetratricopeptide (TPR) repeat protein